MKNPTYKLLIIICIFLINMSARATDSIEEVVVTGYRDFDVLLLPPVPLIMPTFNPAYSMAISYEGEAVAEAAKSSTLPDKNTCRPVNIASGQKMLGNL